MARRESVLLQPGCRGSRGCSQWSCFLASKKARIQSRRTAFSPETHWRQLSRVCDVVEPSAFPMAELKGTVENGHAVSGHITHIVAVPGLAVLSSPPHADIRGENFQIIWRGAVRQMA